jgi:hypothetical protein
MDAVSLSRLNLIILAYHFIFLVCRFTADFQAGSNAELNVLSGNSGD